MSSTEILSKILTIKSKKVMSVNDKLEVQKLQQKLNKQSEFFKFK
tara:strand:+ start:3614 stop:3748 length:135 start_codon:yes stop_codon:yes gene_type:complete